MIRVYITSEHGNGMVTSMDFEELDEVKLYTANLGTDCEITIEEYEPEVERPEAD